MKQTKQMSETLLVGSLLAMVGGFLDVYTYLTRGGVFANAQTGNIVLLGITLFRRKYQKGTYLFDSYSCIYHRNYCCRSYKK